MDHTAQDPMKMVQTVLRNIRDGERAPCYLLYGDEDYLIKDLLHQIIDIILPGDEKNLNLFWMDGTVTDIEAICESILTPPLMPGNKVVVVNKTSLLSSQSSLPDVVNEILETIETEPQRAAKVFGTFLQMVGWSLEDLQDGGWEKISDNDWRKLIGEAGSTNRDKWLPKIIDISGRFRIEARKKPDDTERFETVLKKGFPDSNYLILTADFVDKRKKIVGSIADVGVVIHLSKEKRTEKQRNTLLHAATDMLQREGKTLSPGAIKALGRKTGFSLRESMGELEKLITYTGDKDCIDEEDIESITRKTKEDSIFDLTSALVDKNLERALFSFRDLLDQGLHHLMILTMIAREIRNLLQGKLIVQAGILSAFHHQMDFKTFQHSVYPQIKKIGTQRGKKNQTLSSQHPYVIFNALKNADRFSFDELVRYLEYLSDIDLTLKTTGKDPKLAIERLIIEMCQ
ncbi:MAG: DNA polymerase III subunit delta [Deltaproteobacteria bacterium]|nr:DNA polymerase III subunit delta [Deltaproteobacteria bacterium]